MKTVPDGKAAKLGGLWGRTPASQQRRHDILLAAKTVFFEQGYQLASIDKIAAGAGTTKRTIYDHFGSKESLFAEVISYGCELFIRALPAPGDLPREPAAALAEFSERVRTLVATADGVRFQRLVIAEAERHPQFGRVLYDTAFIGAERILIDYLHDAIEAGRLKAHDVRVSVRIIMDLATNSVRLRGLLTLDDREEDGLGARALAQVITMFERTYAHQA